MNAVAPLRNMTPFDEIAYHIEALYDEAKNWADGEPIKTQEQHDAVSKLYDDLHAALKEADELRKAEVAPLNEAKDAIQRRFHPLIGDDKSGKGKAVLGKAALNVLLANYREEQKRREREAAELARREREAAEAKAQAAMQASSGNLAAREEAEFLAQQAKLAADDEKRMARIAAKGNGLRTVPRAEITDFDKAARHYWGPERPSFEALVLQFAQRDATAGKRNIPGVTVHEEKRAI